MHAKYQNPARIEAGLHETVSMGGLGNGPVRGDWTIEGDYQRVTWLPANHPR